MARTLLWIRYGICTLLGLTLLGLASLAASLPRVGARPSRLPALGPQPDRSR